MGFVRFQQEGQNQNRYKGYFFPRHIYLTYIEAYENKKADDQLIIRFFYRVPEPCSGTQNNPTIQQLSHSTISN
jgi:hypothetical protein